MIGFAVKAWLDSLALPWYILTGRRPWTLGYYTAKKKAISRGIDDRLLMDSAALPKGYGAFIDERVVEYPWVFAQLPKNPGRLLDAGSALNHDFLLDRAPLSGAQLTVMTLAPEKRCFWNRGISYLYGDLREPHFPDACFDVVVSVSTIEHIGLDNTMLYTGDHTKQETDDLGYVPAIEQFRRVLKPGGVCLVTVPFGRRGTHGWYQVFDERGHCESNRNVRAHDPFRRLFRTWRDGLVPVRPVRAGGCRVS
jgi:SAM-dependent methyltransferase